MSEMMQSVPGLELSPPYWVPFLIALAMMLTFLAYVLRLLFKEIMEPIRHTLDNTNDLLSKTSEAFGRVDRAIAVMLDRDTRDSRDSSAL